MLREWLAEMSLGEFRRAYLGKTAFSLPGSAQRALSACTWRAVDEILGADPPPDTLVVSRGELSVQPTPRTLAELHALFATGVGVVVRHAQRQHAPLLALCRAFAEDVPGEQRVLVFATPKGTHGFGWHYDAEEVFIVQTAGKKQYLFRKNTIDPEPVLHAQPDFSTIRNETTPVFSCTLHAGDWLYLPRGTWHVAKPLEHSLSISIGVVPERLNRIV